MTRTGHGSWAWVLTPILHFHRLGAGMSPHTKGAPIVHPHPSWRPTHGGRTDADGHSALRASYAKRAPKTTSEIHLAGGSDAEDGEVEEFMTDGARAMLDTDSNDTLTSQIERVYTNRAGICQHCSHGGPKISSRYANDLGSST
jgi:hypothetical protein